MIKNKLIILYVLILILNTCKFQLSKNSMSVNHDSIEKLKTLSLQDNFKAEENDLYTGVHEPLLKDNLNKKFKSVIDSFIHAIENKTSKSEYIDLLRKSINNFNRYNLDTEDAEHVAYNFKEIMDIIGLDSSEGILNEWLYDFDPK